MKHQIGVFFTALLATMLCASCVNAPTAPVDAPAYVPAKPAAAGASVPVLTVEAAADSTFRRFGETLCMAESILDIHLPDAVQRGYYVDVTEELRAQLWDTLLLSSYRSVTEQEAAAMETGEYEWFSMSVTLEEQCWVARFYGYSEQSLSFPEQVLIEISVQESQAENPVSRWYAGERAVYDSLQTVLHMHMKETRVILNQDAVTLQSACDMTALSYGEGFHPVELLQFGDRFLWRYWEGGEGIRPSHIELFDARTGELLSQSVYDEPVYRVEKSQEESGFDYRVFTATQIVYKSSKNDTAEKIYALPSAVQLHTLENKTEYGAYDQLGDLLVWVGADGIYAADKDGGNARVLLYHADIRTLTGKDYPQQNDSPGNLLYASPHILNGGMQLSAPVVLVDTDVQYAGIVVYDFVTGKATGFFNVFSPLSASIAYPGARTIAAASAETVTLIDAAAQKTQTLPFPRGAVTDAELYTADWQSNDYNTYLVSEDRSRSTDDANFISYLVNMHHPEDRSKVFLTATGSGNFRFIGVTERYAVGRIADASGVRFVLMKIK